MRSRGNEKTLWRGFLILQDAMDEVLAMKALPSVFSVRQVGIAACLDGMNPVKSSMPVTKKPLSS